MKWCIAAVAVLSLLVGVGAHDARAASAPFVVQQAAGYQGDPPGSKQPETTPDAIEPGRWPVDVAIQAPLCVADGLYAWSWRGTTVPSARTGPCRYRLFFPGRGDHLVTLTAESGGRTTRVFAHVPVRGWLIAVIGDSVASGEGVPDVPGKLHARWQSSRCHRSARAAPSLAAVQLQRAIPDTPVTFVSFACSGASVGEGLLKPYRGLVWRPRRKLVPQLDALAALAERRRVDALVISAGANDLHFGDVVRACMRFFHPRRFRACFDRPAPWDKKKTLRAAVARLVDELRRRYAELAQRLRSMPVDHVLLVQYFNPLTDSHRMICHSIAGITHAMLARADEELLQPLDETGRQAAKDGGWGYVDGVQREFAGHGYCAADAHRWVVDIPETLATQSGLIKGRVAGMLHPNATGHGKIADLIASRLEATLTGPGRPRATSNPNEVSDALADGLVGAGVLAVFGLVGLGVVRRTAPGRHARARRP